MVRRVTSSAGALAHRDPASAAARRGGTHGSCLLEVPWHMLPPESQKRVNAHVQPTSDLCTHTHKETIRVIISLAVINDCYHS
jgi:hypothetical protein